MLKALQRGKVTPAKALRHQHKAEPAVKQIYDIVEGRDERLELNLYISGSEDDLADAPAVEETA